MNSLSETTLRDYDRLDTAWGSVSLPEYRLIALTGDDRLEWLQGQVTNDLRRFEPGKPLSFCLCSATGQLQAMVDAWAEEDRILLSLDDAAAPAFLRRVSEMVIMEDVEAEILDLCLTTYQGPLALEFLPSGFLNDRSGRQGVDVWSATPKGPTCDREAFEVMRIEAGRPKFGVDTNAKTLPPELGPAFDLRYVSYAKGCYTGQEVLMRIHSRGHTNRALKGILSDEPLAAGQDLGFTTLTSAAFSPRLGNIGLGMVRHDAEILVAFKVIDLPFRETL